MMFTIAKLVSTHNSDLGGPHSTVMLPTEDGQKPESHVTNRAAARTLEAGDSLTTEQWLTLIILAAFDVGLLIAAIAWRRRRKRVENGKKEGLAELHKDHFGG
jgi:hypothetical protein